MRRSLPIHWPSVRSVPGNSFGPITISATTPIRRSSPQPMSNIALSTPRGADLQAGAPPSIEPVAPWRLPASAYFAGVRRSACCRWCPASHGGAGGRRRLMVDGLHRIDLGRVLGLFILRQTLLERLDALGEVAHQ